MHMYVSTVLSLEIEHDSVRAIVTSTYTVRNAKTN